MLSKAEKVDAVVVVDVDVVVDDVVVVVVDVDVGRSQTS